MTDDGTGSLFSTITANYTTPLWLAEKANLRKISSSLESIKGL